jgi:hypothetical protein
MGFSLEGKEAERGRQCKLVAGSRSSGPALAAQEERRPLSRGIKDWGLGVNNYFFKS